MPGLMAAPIHWLGGSALFAHNVLVFAGLTLTTLAPYWLVRDWTGDCRAGLLSGALFARVLVRLGAAAAATLAPAPLVAALSGCRERPPADRRDAQDNDGAKQLSGVGRACALHELPIYGFREFHRNARYLLASTTHWPCNCPSRCPAV
ncbi:MAG: hypothetical protein OXG04_05005 [Acidobacteria bacterium]|nr:hypothetical protein [Acidobacteriota bacterium]